MRPRLALALLVLLPVLALAAVDRAIVHWTGLWTWVAGELPKRLDDPLRVEALLRSIPPGRQNVLLLGNSRADDSLDLAALEKRFAADGLRFWNLTIAGAGVVEYAMRARAIGRLEPRAALLMVHAASFGGADWREQTWGYDTSAAAHLFRPRELADSLGLQLNGLAGELHVLARHRSGLQNALLVWSGRETFQDVERARVDEALRGERIERRALRAWHRGLLPEASDGPDLRALDWLNARLRERGTRLIVVEAPNNPVTVPPEAQPRLLRFRSFLAEHARREGFTFVSGSTLPTFGLEDFRDRVHASPSGKARYTASVGRALESLLVE